MVQLVEYLPLSLKTVESHLAWIYSLWQKMSMGLTSVSSGEGTSYLNKMAEN